jgi:two-component system, cell cycle response regulator
VLPETGYEPALEAARKLRCGIAQQPFTVDGKQAVITASFGLCGLDRVPLGERRIPEHMLKVADAALYKSKHAGRNRVTATLLQNKASMSQRPPEPVAKSRAD